MRYGNPWNSSEKKDMVQYLYETNDKKMSHFFGEKYFFLYWFFQNSSNSSQNSFKEPNQIKANGNVPRVQVISCSLGTIPLQMEKCSHVFISQNVLSHLSHRLVILFNCNYIFYKTAAPQWVNQRVGVPNPPYFYHKKRIFFLFY